MRKLDWILLAIISMLAGCGDGNHGPGDALLVNDDAIPEENPAVVEKTVPETVFGASRPLRERACFGDVLACEDEPDECAPDHLDQPDEELEAGGGFLSIIEETWNSITKPVAKHVDGIAKNVGKDVTLEFSAYNAVPGYRIEFDCENADKTFQRKEFVGGTAVDLHTESCRLETSKDAKKVAFRLRRVNDNGKVVPDIETTMLAPSMLLPSQLGLNEGVYSVEVEGGMRVTFTYFTPGTQDEGLAGTRRLATMYFTSSKDNWMRDMPAAFGDRPLRQWVLPGSHDAGMYVSNLLTSLPVVSTFAVTQEQTTFEQLRLGTRYFDVRPAWAQIPGAVDGVYAVHTVIPGARYATMLDDALRFLAEVGKEEIVIFHLSRAGIIAPWSTDGRTIQAELDKALARRGLPKSFVGDELSLNLSPAELRAMKRRFIVLDNVSKRSSWGDANEEPATLAAYVRDQADGCTADTAKVRDFVTELQLQSTAPHAIVNTLLGNKIVLDRSYFPWLAGGVRSCATGPTVMLNDYVDNGLTDVVARGQIRGDNLQDTFSVNQKPSALGWQAGKLDWKGPHAVATRNVMLSHGAGGDFSVYRLARDPKTGAVCNRMRVWSAPQKGDRVVFQEDGNLVVYDGTRATWASNTVKTGAHLFLDNDGEISVADKSYRPMWNVKTGDRGVGLSCGSPPAERVFAAGTLKWEDPQSVETSTQRLTMQDDGNLVLYRIARNENGAICAANAQWSSGTRGAGKSLVFDGAGELLVRATQRQVDWQSGTAGNANNKLRIAEDGLSILRPGQDPWRGGEPVAGSTCTWRELEGSAKTERVTWDTGKLVTKGFQVLGATKDVVLAFEGGELALYRVARGASGAVCRKKQAWRVGRGGAPDADDYRVRFDASSALSIRDPKGNSVWSSGGNGSRLVLGNGGLEVLAVDNRVVWSVPIDDRAALTCTGG